MVWRFYFEAVPLARFVSATRAKRRCSPCPKLLKLLLWTDKDTNGYDTIEATHQQFKTTTNIEGTKCANCKGNVWIRQRMSWKCKLLGPSSWRSTFQWGGCRVISCDKLQQGKTGRSVGLHAIYGTVHMTIPSLWNEFDHLLGRLRTLEENKIQAENHERDAPSLKSAQLPKTKHYLGISRNEHRISGVFCVFAPATAKTISGPATREPGEKFQNILWAKDQGV